MAKDNVSAHLHDVDYGLASAAISGTANTIVTTTGANYHGFSMVAGTTKVTVAIYDNATTTAGNIIDAFIVNAGGAYNVDRYIPVKAKNGLVVSVTGTAAIGTIFYGPKG